MSSRFSETARNSPFAAPFSVAKCSSDSTPAPRRSRIMAAPNTDGKCSNRLFEFMFFTLPYDFRKVCPTFDIIATFNLSDVFFKEQICFGLFETRSVKCPHGRYSVRCTMWIERSASNILISHSALNTTVLFSLFLALIKKEIKFTPHKYLQTRAAMLKLAVCVW